MFGKPVILGVVWVSATPPRSALVPEAGRTPGDVPDRRRFSYYVLFLSSIITVWVSATPPRLAEAGRTPGDVPVFWDPNLVTPPLGGVSNGMGMGVSPRPAVRGARARPTRPHRDRGPRCVPQRGGGRSPPHPASANKPPCPFESLTDSSRKTLQAQRQATVSQPAAHPT